MVKKLDIKTIKVLESSKNFKTWPNGVQKSLYKEMAFWLSYRLYVEVGNNIALLEMGFSEDELRKFKRKPGRPSVSLLRDRDIVQLVAKQQYQAGLKFNNFYEKELNECFLAVAENNGISVHLVIKQYNRVDKEERHLIFDKVKKILFKHGLLHSRFIRS